MSGWLASLLKIGGFLTLAGAALTGVGILWLGSGSPTVEWTATLPGLAGMLLTTVCLLAFYPFLSREGDSGGILWCTLGVAVVLLSVAALVLVVLLPAQDGQSRLLTTAWVIIFWIRPLGIVLFAFALVRADILFGRALLLFAIALAEMPLLSNLFATGTDGDWLALVFGIPDLQSGLLSALLWAGFGYSEVLLSRDASGGDAGTTSLSPIKRL